ncbi:MAG: transposase [Pseudomonas sp.]
MRVHRPDHQHDLVLVTNDMTRSAAQIAACYKARWGIVLFFKWIKQHLRIKAFFGRSQNAVRIQLLCALITYLLVALYRQTQPGAASLLRTLDELRAGLFQRPETDLAAERRRRRDKQAQLAVQPELFS